MEKTTFEQQLRSYYQSSFPDCIDPQITLDWVNTKGWESEIYAYTLIYGSPGNRTTKKRVLRLLTGGGADAGKGEFQTLSLLNKAGYPVPQADALGDPDDGFDRPFIIMQRIEGGDFSARFPHSPDDDLTPLKNFIHLFRQLHTLDWRSYVDEPEKLAPPDDPYFHFDREMRLYHQYLIQSGFTMFEPLMAWISARRERAFCAESSVIHRDFHPDNILEDQDGVLYVVDWTSAEISDYRFDLAWTLTLTLAYSGEVRKRMILDEYERQLGHPVPGLALFEVISILRRIGTVMISLGAGAETLGMRPETVEAMRKDRDPLMRLFQRLQYLTGLDLPQIQRFIADLT